MCVRACVWRKASEKSVKNDRRMRLKSIAEGLSGFGSVCKFCGENYTDYWLCNVNKIHKP